MKYLYSILILSFLTCGNIISQQPILISEDSLEFAGSTMPGFKVLIPEATYDKTVKNWTKELESGTRSKIVEKNNEMSIFGARIKDVSDNPVNIYSTIHEGENTIELLTAIELERNNFITGSDAGNAKQFLFDFAKEQYMEVVDEQLSAEKSKLRDLEGDLNSLQRAQSRMETSSKNNTELIAEEEERLRNLTNELEYLTAGNDSGEVVVGMGASNPDDARDIEKQTKKIEREISSAEKKISRAEAEIEENSRAVPKNAEAQESARNKVTEQQAVVRSLEEKLDNIKDYKL